MSVEKIESGKTIELDTVNNNLELGDGVTLVAKKGTIVGN